MADPRRRQHAGTPGCFFFSSALRCLRRCFLPPCATTTEPPCSATSPLPSSPPPPPLLLLASAMDAHCRRAALHAARWGLPHASRDGGSLHIMYDDGTVYSTQNESSLVTSGVLHAARSANSPVAGVTVLGGNFGDGVSLASSRVRSKTDPRNSRFGFVAKHRFHFHSRPS